jgi:hypothetical protein
MSDEAPPSSDRRRAMRRIACFPAFVELKGEVDHKITAMISDLAETGTKILMRHPELGVGEDIRLELHVLLDEGAMRAAGGKVVRISPLPDERASLWTHEVGVEFHETFTLDKTEIDALEKRQLPFGKRA